MDKKILVHACCGPCSVAFVDGIIKEGYEPHLLWYNPNIHPYTEYKSRKNSLIDYAKQNNLPAHIHEYYGLRAFVKEALSSSAPRCVRCYFSRLIFVAKYAKEKGFANYSTTLLASPYQDYDLIGRQGTSIAKNIGLDFIIRDFRHNFRDGINIARESGLYIQKYCGCIFSEEERYLKNGKGR